MTHSFAGARIAIVGAAGGIGAALSRRLKKEGAELLLLGRSEAKLKALGDELEASAQPVDAADSEALQRALAAFGGFTGIVNCAGSVLLKPAHLTSDAEWADTLRTNLTTAFHTVRAGAKAMMQTGGSIVLCSTAAARTGLANHEAIAAAKAGIIGLTLSAAATYAGRNIRINCVAPGLVETPLTARITSNELALKASLGMHALGRMGKPEHVASAIAWLLDPENDWVTGQILGIDGGLGTVRPAK
jgi:NAD(P)-dependent dehydrogenase (short-subunit alcohol dehydrogenase family)